MAGKTGKCQAAVPLSDVYTWNLPARTEENKVSFYCRKFRD
jgi:hypothetical protein